jgi:protease-4
VLVLIILAVAVSAMGLVAMALFVGREPQVSGNSTLVLKIGGDLQEMEPSGVIGQFFEAPPTVHSLVDSLRKAKVDNRVSSVIIRPTGEAALWGKIQEVRDAISDFRRSGKPIIGYLEYGGEQEFYLASACDKVFLMPTASLDLTGMANYELFLRGTLDKIGAFPDTLHIGEYKTASNTFTEHTFTPAHREMAESLNTDLYEQLIRGIAGGRHKSEKEVRALIDHGPFLPEDAVRAGLVDDVAYEDEIDDKVQLAKGKVNYLTELEYRHVSAHRGDLRDGCDCLRRQQLRLAIGSGGGRGHDGRFAAKGTRGLVHQGDCASHRQSGRLGDRLGRHLARSHVDTQRQAAGGVDVRRRGFGRVLHRDAGPRHRGRARHAHGLHRGRHAEVRDRRHAEKARHEHGGRVEGPLRRFVLACARIHA